MAAETNGSAVAASLKSRKQSKQLPRKTSALQERQTRQGTAGPLIDAGEKSTTERKKKRDREGKTDGASPHKTKRKEAHRSSRDDGQNVETNNASELLLKIGQPEEPQTSSQTKGRKGKDAHSSKVAKEKKKDAKKGRPKSQSDVAKGIKLENTSETNTRCHPGREWTVSIAVAGSIVDNAQSLELATALAGQIARAAAIFCIDEIVVFEDGDDDPGRRAPRWRRGEAGDSGAVFLARLLQYCETPQYLRRHLIPMHPDLRTAGLLAPLDAPHHARAHEWIPYREGVVVAKPSAGGKIGGNGSLVNVGLQKEVRISQSLEPGLRVTVAMGTREALDSGKALSAVSPSEPRERLGLYWGYSVRLAKGLSGVLAECPYRDGYDYSLGTSEHGEKLTTTELVLPSFKHLLIVFGGLAGLEESTELDSNIEVKNTASLFDRYLNTCSGQGSRTIRTEEALLISLTFLHEPIQRAIKR